MSKLNPSLYNMNIKINEDINENLAFKIDNLLADLAKGRMNNSTCWIYLEQNSQKEGYIITTHKDILGEFKTLNQVVKYLEDSIKYKKFFEEELNIKFKHIALTLDSNDLSSILELADLDKGKMSFNVERELMEIVKHYLSSEEFKLKFAVTIAKQIKLMKNVSIPLIKQIGEIS